MIIILTSSSSLFYYDCIRYWHRPWFVLNRIWISKILKSLHIILCVSLFIWSDPWLFRILSLNILLLLNFIRYSLIWKQKLLQNRPLRVCSSVINSLLTFLNLRAVLLKLPRRVILLCLCGRCNNWLINSLIINSIFSRKNWPIISVTIDMMRRDSWNFILTLWRLIDTSSLIVMLVQFLICSQLFLKLDLYFILPF